MIRKQGHTVIDYSGDIHESILNLSNACNLSPAEVGKLAIDTLQFLVNEMQSGTRIDIVRPDRLTSTLELGVTGYQIDSSLQDPNMTVEDLFGNNS